MPKRISNQKTFDEINVALLEEEARAIFGSNFYNLTEQIENPLGQIAFEFESLIDTTQAQVDALVTAHDGSVKTAQQLAGEAKAQAEAAAAQEAALATALAQSPQLLRFMSESTADAVTMASSLTDAEFKALVATVLHKLNDATQPALTAGMQAWLAAERAAGNTPTDAEYQAQYAALAENPL